MASARTYTPDLLPESALPEDLAEQGLYKAAGMGCDRCEFVTKKTGLSGRQALRAHLKRHKNDARAWRGPLLRQGLLAGAIIVLIIMGMMASPDLKVDLQSMLPFSAPMEMIPTAIIGWSTMGASIALILASWYMMAVPGEVGGQLLVRVLLGLRVAGTLLGLWVVVVVWGVIGPELSWPMTAPAVVLVAVHPDPGG